MIDLEILEKIGKGDKHSFKVLYDAYRHKVFGTSFLVLKDKQLAEDVVQESFLQIYLNIKSLSNLYGFDKWVYRITTGICIDKLRKMKKIDIYSIEDDNLRENKYLVDESIGLEDHIMKKELELIIMQAINSLSAKHRTVVTLFYYNDFDITEIAEIMKMYRGHSEIKAILCKKRAKRKAWRQGFKFFGIISRGRCPIWKQIN